MIHKALRTITSFLPVDKGRTGACNHCGECCKLPFRCVFLRTDDGGRSYCAVYRFRPLNCRRFPRTESQLRAVSHVCGYSFEKRTVHVQPPLKRAPEGATD